MFTKLSELHQAARRLLPAFGAEDEARKVVAASLGFTDWLAAAAAIESKSASYGVDWLGRARNTYYESCMRSPGPAPRFEEIFVAEPPCGIAELTANFPTNVRRIASRSKLHHLLTPYYMVPGDDADPQNTHKESLFWGDLTLSIRQFDPHEPSCGLWFYDWSAWVSRSGEQIAHAVGSLYATKRGHFIDFETAIESADMNSDLAVAAVSAILRCREDDGLEGRYAVVEDVFVIPSDRGHRQGSMLLRWVCNKLRQIKTGAFYLVLDRKAFVDSIQYPAEVAAIDARATDGKIVQATVPHALEVAVDLNFVKPLRRELHQDGVAVFAVDSLSPMGPYQTMHLVGTVVATGKVPEMIPDEESAAIEYAIRSRALAELWKVDSLNVDGRKPDDENKTS